MLRNSTINFPENQSYNDYVDGEVVKFRQSGLSSFHISPQQNFVQTDDVIHTYINEETGELIRVYDVKPRVEWFEVNTLVYRYRLPDDEGTPLFEPVVLQVPVERQSPSYVSEASATIYLDGSLVRVQPDVTRVRDSTRWRVARETRGKAQFSKGSRRRLMRKIAMTKRQDKPLFVTLTYPDDFPGNAKKWKRDIDVLGKRFLRAFSSGAFVWRLEVLPRQSGENKGALAPHFHLLAWSVSYASLRDWLPQNWFEVVGSGDVRHFEAGTRVEYIKSWNGVMRYASKYVAKVNLQALGDVGRWWGIVGRDNMPWSVSVEVALASLDAVKAIRLGRKMIGLTGKDLRYGLTWIVSGREFLRYLEFLDYFRE